MASDKEPPEKIFCLFHRKTDCICIAPVIENETLQARLGHAIRLNEINNKFEPDMELKARREKEIVEFRTRME